MRFSVVICTHNRARLLQIALQSLTEQILPYEQFEIIVVDNVSTDSTRDITETFMSFGNVRYVYEEKIGLSHARNRGMQEAQGEYVVYTDDDCKLPPQWLTIAEEVISQHQPILLSGSVVPLYVHQPITLYLKPNWFKDDYGTLTIYQQAGWMLDNQFAMGGNFFIQKNLLKEFGGFDPEYGMMGTKLFYAEETALQMRIRAKYPQLKFYNDPRLYVQHLVRREKMSVWWYWRSIIAQKRSLYRMEAEFAPETRPFLSFWRYQLSQLIRISLRILWDVGRMWIIRDRHHYRYWQNFAYERISIHIGRLGTWYERMKLYGKKVK